VREGDNLTTFMFRMSWKSESLNFLEHSGPHRACYGIPLPLSAEEGRGKMGPHGEANTNSKMVNSEGMGLNRE
jgi:hypothetical protein